MRFRVAVIGAVALLTALSTAVHAQGYPAKPVRILVGFTPGAGIDIAIRLIAPKMGEALGQQIVVDNRPGAGSNIAAELTVRAPADGYTLFAGGAPVAISATSGCMKKYETARSSSVEMPRKNAKPRTDPMAMK